MAETIVSVPYRFRQCLNAVDESSFPQLFTYKSKKNYLLKDCLSVFLTMKINLCVMNDPDVLPMLHLFRTEAAIMFTSSVVFSAQCRHVYFIHHSPPRELFYHFVYFFISF